MKTKDLALEALIAAVYIAVTVLLKPISYGFMQVRVSEIMLILVLFNRKHSYGLILGCLLANFVSDAGIMDVIFGTLATSITCLLMSLTKDDHLALVWPAIVNGLIVGAMLGYVLEVPYLPAMGWVFLGEFIATFIPGLFLVKPLKKNAKMQEIFG
ncbi:QueT transporter family protein [Erysipelothrix tonsillarum]|uniref:QueT transporter family protein n=1 Tax=Erysipelothrix tonsillarum TaxID=38402 RepID=UPI00037FE53F|nr:QueT transporter family protein [Erysipelothrix tonsillarum]